ncbi:c-type cytochrome [Pedobacter metabolipauper]|uniref:Cbb3-type cytochrome c oxidase subunit III n=1 Tax=Pedobacter metabolipauper TaxID=425513 RepID=A0A4R6SY16_9SPHI|nr:cytochrome c [Pedobacter metabolipauper]TDQ11296.1 cbb3-type cytochrome c oxidase subunit III [Pedobacter metabolipauper]
MRRTVLSLIFIAAIASMIYSCQGADQLKQDIYYTNGRDIYIKNCQNCHGVNGEGLGALTPGLTDSIFLKENKQKIACIIKYGMDSTITINGQQFEDKMPDFNTLANIDLAQLIVYVTNSFGNKQGMYTPEQVAADLKKCSN